VDAVIHAVSEVHKSDKFKKLLEFVLAVGNYLNGGTARGQAYGFKLEALKKLRDTKTADNQSTLLHYLVQLVDSKNPEVSNFPKDLKHVVAAARGKPILFSCILPFPFSFFFLFPFPFSFLSLITKFVFPLVSVPNIQANVAQLKQGFKLVETEIPLVADSAQDTFKRQLQEFMERSTSQFANLELDMKTMEDDFNKIAADVRKKPAGSTK